MAYVCDDCGKTFTDQRRRTAHIFICPAVTDGPDTYGQQMLQRIEDVNAMRDQYQQVETEHVSADVLPPALDPAYESSDDSDAEITVIN